jgi:adenine C2-methylase RlmN of 23S rRNA A2503 and tRNA A37
MESHQTGSEEELLSHSWSEVVHIWNTESGENLSARHIRTIASRAMEKIRVALVNDPSFMLEMAEELSPSQFDRFVRENIHRIKKQTPLNGLKTH